MTESVWVAEQSESSKACLKSVTWFCVPVYVICFKTNLWREAFGDWLSWNLKLVNSDSLGELNVLSS